MWVHLVARCNRPRHPFLEPDSARWIWGKLEGAFPDTLACVLMPDHLHLVTSTTNRDEARNKLGALLGGFSRRYGNGPIWYPVPPAQQIRGAEKLARQVRYVTLNPCRDWGAGLNGPLAMDPLAWEWTTHRDVIGAVHRPWVDRVRLAWALRDLRPSFQRRFHRYVSSDPSVAVRGTGLPRPVIGGAGGHTLDDVALAACRATRSPADAIARKGDARHLFVLLAVDQGWTSDARVASTISARRWTTSRLAKRADPALLAAGQMCLGDRRLLRPTVVLCQSDRVEDGRVRARG